MDMWTVLIRDRKTEMQYRVPCEEGRLLFASLSADPDSIEELRIASRRFVSNRRVAANQLANANPNEAPQQPAASHKRDDPWWHAYRVRQTNDRNDRPDYVVDLPGRLVTFENHVPAPPHTAHLPVTGKQSERPYAIEYELALDWEIRPAWSGWRDEAIERRNVRDQWMRQGNLLIDARLVTDLSHEICRDSAVKSRHPLREQDEVKVVRGVESLLRPEWLTADVEKSQTLRIHAKWLLRSRSTLGGKCIRDYLIGEIDHIERDIQHREEQWMLIGAEPKNLRDYPRALSLLGCGPGEYYLMFLLVQELIKRGLKFIQHAKRNSVTLSHLQSELSRAKQNWLDSTQHQQLLGLSPAQIIQGERERAPLTWPDNPDEESCACPICALTEGIESVSFWHLDETWIPHSFVFSRFEHRDEWLEYIEWHGYEEADIPGLADYERIGVSYGTPTSITRVDESTSQGSAFILLFDLGAKLSTLMECLRNSELGETNEAFWMQIYAEIRQVSNEDSSIISLADLQQRIETELSDIVSRVPHAVESVEEVRRSLESVVQFVNDQDSARSAV